MSSNLKVWMAKEFGLWLGVEKVMVWFEVDSEVEHYVV